MRPAPRPFVFRGVSRLLTTQCPLCAFCARHSRQVALKFLSKENLLKRQTRMVRVKREIRILKLLHHPNIVHLYDVAETEKEIILTMEYAGGGELFDYIVAHSRLKEKEARRIFRQVLSAVAYCHENCIIHRDLKPENILLDNDRNVKIIGALVKRGLEGVGARERGQGRGKGVRARERGQVRGTQGQGPGTQGQGREARAR